MRILIFVLILVAQGCAPISGNYPPLPWRTAQVAARFDGEDFQLLAGSRLPLEQAEAELAQLKSQGFSRRDPQIIKSVARRKHIPAALLADRTGCAYYRITARLKSGTNLTLAPGTLEVTVKTKAGLIVTRDQGFLLVDNRAPGGCRPPDQATLALGEPHNTDPVSEVFLIRLPVRGEIVGLTLAPHLDPRDPDMPPP